ncbi:LacI family DNA-binding transcriptional regulator [Gilvimarinus chinensis]|uniref:LacI family DNA-binding transcriptional regulator n=1 Tax=Gilvimarinus chinensis TaxID=396005 RepID=UPI0003797101|nr:LacI family DNA-binding transcriptional regulator [Gilvimarinus chinensis]
MKPTIKDVAKLAGVSFKTVSRVINNEGTVGQELQDRVWKAVKQLNYRPNLSARGLRGAASSIGFIYDNPNSNYVIDMQKGILDECRKQGYELVIHPCDAANRSIVQEVQEMIDRSRVGGLVLTPPISENAEILAAISERNIKFVRVLSGAKAPDDLSPCIYIDDRNAAYAITEHLIKLGHRDIAFLGGDEEHQSSGERLAGYKAALEDNGIKYVAKRFLPGSYSFESGVERTRKLLTSKGENPTAIFACNDEIAAGTLFAARIEGIDVPRTLSIAGFEDSPFSRQAWPNLTTAAQPTSTIAQKAASLLIKSLRESKKVESEGFYPELIVRESSCPPPAK